MFFMTKKKKRKVSTCKASYLKDLCKGKRGKKLAACLVREKKKNGC